jgi:ribosome-associated protein
MSAISDKIQENLKEKSIPIISVEGKGSSEWVLLDLGDIVVNIMSKSARELYDLESLWDPDLL